MLIVKVTTSTKTLEFHLDAPVNDSVDLHYRECNYCGDPTREESIHRKIRKFCGERHRWQYAVTYHAEA